MSAIVLCLAVVQSGCGNSHTATSTATAGDPSLPAGAIARVGSTLVTQAELNHAMNALLSGDFYKIIAVKAPSGLATDLPNYQSCAAKLGTFAAELAGRRAPLTNAQLLERCRELNDDIKFQALNQILSRLHLIGLDAEVGITVSDQEVAREFAHIRTTSFPTERDLQSFLANRDWVLADELTIVKLDMLSSKLRHALIGKDTMAQLIEFAHKGSAKWIARTICRPGYVVSECSEYKNGGGLSEVPESTSPAVIIERLGKLRPKGKFAPDLNCKNTSKGNGLSCQQVGKLK